MPKHDNTALIFALAAGGVALFAFSGAGEKTAKVIKEKVKELLPVGPVDFIKKFLPAAKESEKLTGVPALVILAQAGIESNWGKSAPGFNFFGVKAGKSWKGDTQKLRTWECGKTGDPARDGIRDEIIKIYAPGEQGGICGADEINIYDDPQLRAMFGNKYAGFVAPYDEALQFLGAGKMYSYRVYGKFRKYASALEGFVDHGRFLKENKRYAKAFTTSTPEAFAKAVAAAGYATAPNYAEVIVKAISKVRDVFKSWLA